MCYVIIYKDKHLIQQAMQIDDGSVAYAYAKNKGYSIRIWDMLGFEKFSQFDKETKDQIKRFLKSLK